MFLSYFVVSFTSCFSLWLFFTVGCGTFSLKQFITISQILGYFQWLFNWLLQCTFYSGKVRSFCCCLQESCPCIVHMYEMMKGCNFVLFILCHLASFRVSCNRASLTFTRWLSDSSQYFLWKCKAQNFHIFHENIWIEWDRCMYHCNFTRLKCTQQNFLLLQNNWLHQRKGVPGRCWKLKVAEFHSI